MRILLACDKFKGTLTAAQVHDHLTPALLAAGHEVTALPIADGGDGTVAAAVSAGYAEHTTRVTGPLGTPVEAKWAQAESTAVIEMAQASGLALITPTRDSALQATSYGTGELITAALDAGCSRIVLGVGGSATTDGGAGMLEALGVRLLDPDGQPVSPGGVGLRELARVDISSLNPQLHDGSTHVVLASDVQNPLTGPAGAAAIYGPQKGAGPEEIEILDAALGRFAAHVPDGQHHAERVGAGAAGGTGFAAFAVLQASSVPGADFVLDLVGFDTALDRAEAVVTGEGRFDSQTLSGKGPGAVIEAARNRQLPVHIVCGASEFPPDTAADLGLRGIHSLTDLADLSACLEDPGAVLEDLAPRLAETIAAA